MSAYEYKIGSTLGGIQLLNALNPPVIWPRHDFTPYAEQRVLGNGKMRAVGLPKANWYWDFIYAAQWDVLYAYRTGVTTSLFIRTKDENDDWKTYAADMVWPINLQWVVTRGLKFQLSFRNLVLQT